MFYDGHVAGFVGGATETDDGRERGLCDASKKSEAVQSSVADPINTKILLYALERHAETNTAQHCLPRLSGTFCTAEWAVPTVPSSLPPTPTRAPRKKQTKDNGVGCD